MYYSDLHIHALPDVDDGAKTIDEACAMLDVCYTEGVRNLCFTPHYHPGIFGENGTRSADAFQLLLQLGETRWPDLHLFLSNELRYERGCVSWLKEGRCRTINSTRYVLVDFLRRDPSELILNGLLEIVNAGFQPILAHAERYIHLTHEMFDNSLFHRMGVLIQVNANSLIGKCDLGERMRSRRMLARRQIDLISSDAHNITTRPPGLSACYEHVCKLLGIEFANSLCRDNAYRVLKGKTII